ncbi:KISS1R [Branchiostoma lanceolatum]|uniref:KISS1R protein n=1 Tax=Branchiostoma lanceolatum TaxID=7740 RepID=A0A8J9YVZ0_BRALA|nr:KISS1R [Branchiostoma lanceolatum]
MTTAVLSVCEVEVFPELAHVDLAAVGYRQYGRAFFRAVPLGVTFDEAKDSCSRFGGGRLAQPLTEEFNDRLKGIIGEVSAGCSFWIGMKLYEVDGMDVREEWVEYKGNGYAAAKISVQKIRAETCRVCRTFPVRVSALIKEGAVGQFGQEDCPVHHVRLHVCLLGVQQMWQSMDGNASTTYLPTEQFFFPENFTYGNVTNTKYFPYPGEFRHLSDGEKAGKIIAYLAIFIMAIVGNSLVIYTVAINKKMRTTTNFYLTNLAVADILIAVCCMWVALIKDLTDPVWIFGDFMCRFNTFMQG